MLQSVMPPTPDVGSGHGTQPRVRLCAQCGVCLRLSPSAALSPLALALSQINKPFLKIQRQKAEEKLEEKTGWRGGSEGKLLFNEVLLG